MLSSASTGPLDDVEFLVRSEHRVDALGALATRPRTRADLLSLTGVSQSTIGRTLRAFEDRNWIRRNGKYYEATKPGAFVAVGVRELLDRVETERRLRDVWRLLPNEADGFGIEMCTDAVVTVARAADPYGPVNRFASLLEETDRLRFVGFDVSLLAPCVDEFCRALDAGMETELIESPGVVGRIHETCPEQFADRLSGGDLTVSVHDALPAFGVGILDTRVAISGCDPDSGAVAVLVDTEDPVARAWAASLYESYRREATPIGLEPTA
ncbi:MarR family transcriptional regulator [Halorubellus sp. JP-L1]|uniref:helix-turn-helix transcriptional regulator n=1 Tax=Halorubellus sp. JP-L1 TaxID=2715753 RepID=UPI00140922EA|nr:MarR family transcriptional regulator [Halorubellus sp. JP-L1]NHN41616.1 MarR family transcriptional regulator [Halorubellus sp. JP-L1]